MRYSLSAIGGKPDPSRLAPAQALGFVTELMGTSPFHAQMPVGALLPLFSSALALDQIKLYFNDYGEFMGYVSWAFLAPDVEQRYLRGKDLNLHMFEWNEGGSLWIIDLLMPRGSINYVLEDLRDNLFCEHDTITYFRIKNGRRIAKRLSRASRNTFFGRPIIK